MVPKKPTPMGLLVGVREHRPGAGEAFGKPSLEPVEASDFAQAEEGHRQEPEDDEEELKDLVEYRRGEAPEEDVDQNDGRREQDARVQVPSEHQVQHQRHGVHVDAGHRDRHDREGDRVQTPRSLVEAELQVLGNAPHAAPVVEGHHEDPEEHHRGNRAHPVEVVGEHPVLGAVRRHPHDLEGAEVRGDEGESRHPARKRASGKEEVLAGVHPSLERETNGEDEDPVDAENEVVDERELHAATSPASSVRGSNPPRRSERTSRAHRNRAEPGIQSA